MPSLSPLTAQTAWWSTSPPRRIGSWLAVLLCTLFAFAATDVYAQQADRMAFSTTDVGGTDGVPASIIQMTASTATITVTTGTFNSLGVLTATTANINAEISISIAGGASVTLATFVITPATAATVTSVTISYTGIITTTAVLTLSVTDASLQSTQATITLRPPLPTTLAFDLVSTTGTTGFNGGTLVIQSQQILNLNFALFNDIGYPRAPATLQTVTMRIANSPFPSNPSVMPTITGVGGVWSSGPAVTSTHANVYICGEDAFDGSDPCTPAGIRLGTIQFGWLGANSTTMTLTLSHDGSVYNSTSLVVTVLPLQPNRLTFSTTAVSGIDGFNANDATGSGNPTTIAIAANSTRASVPLTVTAATFNVIEFLTSPYVPLETSFEFAEGLPTSVLQFTTATVGSSPPLFYNGLSTTTATGQIIYTGEVATTAILQLMSTGNQYIVSMETALVTLAIQVPPAVRLAMSAQQGSHATTEPITLNDGFNNGMPTMTVASISGITSASITFSSYDLYNYLTATNGNSTTGTQTTTFTVSVLGAGLQPVLTAGTAATLNSLRATTTHSISMYWPYAHRTTAVLTIAHDGDASLGSTSITISVGQIPPYAFVFSTDGSMNSTGVNNGAPVVTMTGTTATIIVTASTINNLGILSATTASLLQGFPVFSIAGYPQLFAGVPSDAIRFTPELAVTSGTVVLPWTGQTSKSAVISMLTFAGTGIESTAATAFTLVPPEASALAFSTSSTGGTGEFNNGVLTSLKPGTAVTVTAATFNNLGNLRVVTNTTVATLTVLNGNTTDPSIAPILIAATGFTQTSPTMATISFDGEGTTGEDVGTGAILAKAAGTLTFDWHGSASTTVSLSLSSSGLTTTTLTISVLPRPSVSTTQTMLSSLEDTAATLTVSIDNIGNSVGSLVLTATSSNQSIVTDGAISQQGATGATTSFGFTPVANANGSVSITVTLTDGAYSATTVLTVSIQPVNDAPSFSTGANQTALEDAAAQTSAGWATGISTGPADEAGQNVQFFVNNNNNGLFAVQPAISSTGTLTFTPAANANGVAVVTVYAQDDGGTADGGVNTSATLSFVISVTPVNDAPSFATTNNIAVLDEDGAQTVANHLVSISTGPADEAGQNVQFFVSNDNNALFAVQPAISSTGTLTFTPAHWAQGVATVFAYAQDDGGTADGGVNTSATLSFAISVGLSPATHLRMVGISPVPAQSGESVQVTVASYTALGTQRATTANTTVGLLWNAAYLPTLSGSTQAMLSTGSSEATISVSLFSSSTANITTPAVVEAVGGVLVGTTTSITIQHAVPSIPTATTNNQQASLQWNAPTAQGVTGYAVYRGTVSGSLSEIGTSATTSYVDNTAVNGTTYYYAVKSAAGVLRSGLSGEVEVTIPLLTVTSPNGGEQWQVGTTHAVTWNTVGTVATVAVEYSVNNGGTWLVLTSSTSNTGSYSWFIENPPTTEAIVRVYDNTRPAILDMSDAVFTLVPIVPVTGLTASALDNGVQLSWNSSTSASITGYEIYHGLASGTLTLYATVSATTTTYTHSGLTEGKQHYYALKTIVHNQQSMLSDEVSVVPNTLRVLYPNGGEVMQSGVTHTLQWQYSGDISSMRVEYSTNNGVTWRSIAQTVTLSGNTALQHMSQAWQVPDISTTTALIRVVSLSPTNISDQSDAVFMMNSIVPPTDLMATAGSTTISLSWTASTSASIAQYRILRGTTTSSMSIIDSVGAATTTYTDAGVNACTQYYYAVQTRVGSYASANSNVAGARIVLPESIAVLSPNGGESWQVGVTRSITWTSTACTVPSMVTLEYSSNNGGSWSTIATVSNTGSYAWTVADAASTQAIVRMSGNALSDQSDAVFTIAPIPAPSGLAATAGDGSVGLSWTVSSAESLSGYGIWRSTTSGSLSLLTTVGAATTSYTDNSATNCTLYVYGVTALVGSYHSASSNEAQAEPQITPAVALTSPNGGESWQVGVTRSITWTSTACTVPSMVTLEYSVNSGGSWSTIATVSNTGSYAWTVADAASAQALVRVNDGALSDQSDAVFSIAPIPAPSGLAATAGDGSVGLSWTASSAEGLSGYGIWRGTTSGSLSLLTTVGAATTSYTDNSVTNCTLYVYGVTALVGSYHSASSNEVQATPQITPALVVTSPNGGEQWRMYLPHVITWTSTGCSVPSTVSIDVSLDDGNSWINVTSATANTGSYMWTPVVTPSTQTRIRINGDALSSWSDSVFELLPRPYPSAVASPVATSASYCIDGSIPRLGTVLALSDDYFSATTLVVEVSSSNPALLPVSGIAQTSSTGATTSFAFVPVQNVAGTANVTFTVRNAVESTVTTTVSVSVVVHALPSAVITGSTSACANTGGYTYSVPSEAGGTYAWTVVGGSVTSGAGTREIAVEWGTAGAGSVNVVVMNSNGCSATSLKGVDIHANPVPSIAVGGATTFCSGGSVVLTALPSGMSYMWSNGTTAQSIEVTQSGSYSVMVTNQYGCSVVSTSVSVTVHPAVTASASANGSTTLCSGSSVQLVGGGSSPVGGLTFMWSPTAGLSNANISNPIATPSATTTYTLLVMDGNGCSSTASVTLTVIPAPVITISGDATICEGGSTQLLATGGTNYSWSPTTGLSNANIANPIASPSVTTTYTVTVNGASGCSHTASVTVKVNPVTLQATVLLEGAYAGGSMAANLQAQDLLPTNQPYNAAPFNYVGTEVINVTSGTAIVDWVLVDVRSSTSSGSLVERRAGLLRSDGVIVGSDGGAMEYPMLNASQSYYVVVWHRNHIGVMSALPVSVNSSCGYVCNFTGSVGAAYTQFADSQKRLATGVYGMAAGDVNNDGIVNAVDRVLVNNTSGDLGYILPDISLDGIVNAVDRVLARNNTFWVTQVP